MPARFLLFWAPLAIFLSVQVAGCTAVGYKLGGAIDKSMSKPRPLVRSAIVEVRPGATLNIHMAEGTTVSGIYRGIVFEPHPRYAEGYAAWRDSTSVGFRPPRIGELVRVSMTADSVSGRTFEARFLGFGPQSVRVRRTGPVWNDVLRFDRLAWIADSSGARLTGRELQGAESRMPIQAIARVQQGREEQLVDLLDGRIAAIEVQSASGGFRLAGLVVGIAADASLITFVGALMAGGSSCSPGSISGGFTTGFVVPDSVYVLPRAGDARPG